MMIINTEIETTMELLLFMEESVAFSSFEPVAWPVGGTPIPKERWMTLNNTLRELRMKVVPVIIHFHLSFLVYSSPPLPPPLLSLGSFLGPEAAP